MDINKMPHKQFDTELKKSLVDKLGEEKVEKYEKWFHTQQEAKMMVIGMLVDTILSKKNQNIEEKDDFSYEVAKDLLLENYLSKSNYRYQKLVSTLINDAGFSWYRRVSMKFVAKLLYPFF